MGSNSLPTPAEILGPLDETKLRALLSRAIRRASDEFREPCWVAAKRLTSHGAGVSRELCRQLGLDPDAEPPSLPDEEPDEEEDDPE